MRSKDTWRVGVLAFGFVFVIALATFICECAAEEETTLPVIFLSGPKEMALGDDLPITVSGEGVFNVSITVYARNDDQSRFEEMLTVRGRRVVAIPAQIINETGRWRIEAASGGRTISYTVSALEPQVTSTVAAEVRDFRQQQHTILDWLFRTIQTHRNIISVFLLLLSGLGYLYMRVRR